MTHLDTSFMVDAMRESARQQHGPATKLLEALPENEEIAISLFVLCELYTGVELSAKPTQEKKKVEQLRSYLTVVRPDERLAQVYSNTLARLSERGQRIPTMDLLIGSTAIVEGAALVTRNVRDFERIPGLDVVSY